MSIRSTHLLLVEGDFDVGFLETLLERVGRTQVQVESFDGKDNVDRIEAWSLAPGAAELRWVGVAFDADSTDGGGGPHNRAIRAAQHLERFIPGQVAPANGPWSRSIPSGGKSSSIVVFPDGAAEGDIERRIWETHCRSTNEGKCVESYFNCLHGLGIDDAARWKARVNAFGYALQSEGIRRNAMDRGKWFGEKVEVEGFQDLLALIPSDDECS